MRRPEPTCIRGGGGNLSNGTMQRSAVCLSTTYGPSLEATPPRRSAGWRSAAVSFSFLFFFHSSLIRDGDADIGSAYIRKCRKHLHPAPGVSCHVTAPMVLSAAGFEGSRPPVPFPGPE
ncbi:hypothetical protein LY76DRAFT_342128 [Colletotrichum caudatum]|nr:hypothetical protein LY76DRAFT_342128 [Colletotrichum caudatum]